MMRDYKTNFFLIKKSLYVLVVIIFGVSSCKNKSISQAELLKDGTYYNTTVKKLTDIIVYDIFSPPVASRVYAYPNIAAYECLAFSSDSLKTLVGKLNGLSPVPSPVKGEEYNFKISSLKAFIEISKSLVFSNEKLIVYEKKIFKEIGRSEKNDILERSIAYGALVANHIMLWAEQDNYKQTRSFSKYTVQDSESTWKPTPPDYMDAIEPHWNKIRPFILDSASQFIPKKSTTFSLEKNSSFYNEIIEVYETCKSLSKEQEDIAKFWDCNPFVSHHTGHVMFGTKKITPGGHWIGITSIATKKDHLSFQKTVEAYTWVSITLFDAFISCWDEKYKSVLIRPETLINKYIDKDWKPILQTPPFPEYTSGHSVVSGAASVTLTHLFGDNFFFKDTTEVEFGLPVREFSSFNSAAKEAAISRLYGGIHYMPAITNGLDQGIKIGIFISKKIEVNKDKSK